MTEALITPRERDETLDLLEFRPPFVVFVGAETNAAMAKTAFGVAHWRREDCVGQIGLPGGSVDVGLPNMSVADAIAAGAQTLIIGVAAIGGRIQPDWIDTLEDALASDMDLVSGLHSRLQDDPLLRQAASRSRGRLIDVRVPPDNLPVGTGVRRPGLRALTVGTDCAVGKKYTALALWKAHQTRGGQSAFCASGQTGIMIAGRGVPIDAVVSDFVSGAAELLSPATDPGVWQFIEGQGSLFHPGYAGVSLGLLHGSQPDAIIVCHEAGRTVINKFDAFPVPDLQTCIDHNLACARLTNPGAVCAGVSVNTSSLSDDEAHRYLDETSQRLGLPCVDPIRTDVSPILDALDRIPPNPGAAPL